jgi:c-di-GMP-binding flagellar brake protein YcgR
MSFQSLVVSKDEHASGVLTSVLAGFGFGVQRCGYPDALCRISEQKFDAVIVDYDDPHSAALILQNAYQVSSGNHSVSVALLGDKGKVRSVFGAGANFVLYEPVSEQQAHATLKAAVALLKRERRRSFRVPVQLPVRIQVQNGAEMEGILLDLSEDGLDLLAAKPLYPSAVIVAQLQLPQEEKELEVRGEVAWANPNGESGIRFVDLSESLRQKLRSWVAANAPELVPDDPEPVTQCKLTDLSLGGCYVETDSPFPERSGIVLCLKAADMEVQAEGTVCVMHPEFGMGIEFASRTAEQREQVANFIASLANRPDTQPELLIRPRIIESNLEGQVQPPPVTDEPEDALLQLLRSATTLSQNDFLQHLQKQRSSVAFS